MITINGLEGNGVLPPASAKYEASLFAPILDIHFSALSNHLDRVAKTVRVLAILTAVTAGANLLDLGMRLWAGVNFSW